MLSGVGGGVLASVLNVQSLFFYQRKLDLHHDQTTYWDKHIFLTINLPFDSDVRQWNHPFMIPLHWWWAKSNNRTRSHFECDVTWFCFCFDFVHSHARCRCCFIVCFQVGQIKQPDCKMSTKNVNNYKWKTFPDIFRQLHKATKKQIVKLQLSEKKSRKAWQDYWVDTKNESRPEGRTW